MVKLRAECLLRAMRCGLCSNSPSAERLTCRKYQNLSLPHSHAAGSGCYSITQTSIVAPGSS